MNASRPPALGLLDRYLLRQLGRLFVATIGAVVLLYLVIDFADRAHGFSGRAWGRAAAELYLNKAAVVTYQLAPAALIIAAALLVTQLGRRGELTALLALGVRPLRLAAPVAFFSAGLGAGLFWLGEKVVVRADARAEEIQVKRFNRWGDWGTYHTGASWLRGRENRIFHLGGAVNGGWEPVTILEIAAPFRLAHRIDARRLEPAGGYYFKLVDVTETFYGQQPSSISERREPELYVMLAETAADLQLRSGRPQQMPWFQLREQTRRRRASGQSSTEWELALAERAAQPIQAVPAALAAMGLALTFQRRRPRRRLPPAGAVALGIGLTMALWAASVIAHAVALGGGLKPVTAAAIPPVTAALIAVIVFRRG